MHITLPIKSYIYNLYYRSKVYTYNFINKKLYICVCERHGYPWVSTPARVPEVPVKWTRPARSTRRPANRPGDLIHNPDDLGRPQATSSRLRKTCRACGASFSPRSRCDTASRSEDRRILSVITEGPLPNL
jgi:hypothetical protein